MLLVRLDHAFALGALAHFARVFVVVVVVYSLCRRRGCAVGDGLAGFVHEPARVGGEPLVDLLEALACGFDDEEVDEGDEGRVEDGVEEVEAPV